MQDSIGTPATGPTTWILYPGKWNAALAATAPLRRGAPQGTAAQMASATKVALAVFVILTVAALEGGHL